MLKYKKLYLNQTNIAIAIALFLLLVTQLMNAFMGYPMAEFQEIQTPANNATDVEIGIVSGLSRSEINWAYALFAASFILSLVCIKMT